MESMEPTELTRREFCVGKLGDGNNHKIKEILVQKAQSLSPGDEVCVIEYNKYSRTKDGSQVSSRHTSTLSFDIDKYGTVEVLEILVDIGQEVSEEPLNVFSYNVENTFGNLIESVLIDLAKNKKNLHQGTYIPKSKLRNAIGKYAHGINEERVLFLYDDTVFGSAKDGFLITDSALYFHSLGTRYELRFNEIVSWEHTEVVVQKSKEQVVVQSLEINQGKILLNIPHSTGMLDWSRLDSLLHVTQAVREEGKTKDVDGLVILQDMTDEVKGLYVLAIIWMVYDDDRKIDSRELAELQLLMTKLLFSADLRYQTRKTIENSGDLKLDEIVGAMLRQVPTGSERPIAISLVKDMIHVFQSANNADTIHSPQITEACELLEIDEEQLRFIGEGLEFDRQLLDGSLAPNEMKMAAEALSTKAAAVGIPIAAVYLSGSVAGLSAAGITSGLGALGLGGVLGLSSMVTGIGVVVLLGVGVYKGVQWMVSGNEQKKTEQLRELMLKEVIQNHQKTIGGLGEDLAFFARRVVELTKNVLENKLKIEKLGREVALFADALETLVEREDRYAEALDMEIEKGTGK